MSESSIAISAAGQQTWVNGIKTVLTNLGSHGIGIAYWEPAWIGNAGLGSSCAVRQLSVTVFQAATLTDLFIGQPSRRWERQGSFFYQYVFCQHVDFRSAAWIGDIRSTLRSTRNTNIDSL